MHNNESCILETCVLFEKIIKDNDFTITYRKHETKKITTEQHNYKVEFFYFYIYNQSYEINVSGLIEMFDIFWSKKGVCEEGLLSGMLGGVGDVDLYCLDKNSNFEKVKQKIKDINCWRELYAKRLNK